MNNPTQTIQTEKKKEKKIELGTSPIAEAKKPVDVPKEKQSSPSDSISAEAGINLIPTLSKEEVVVEEKKKKLNIGSIVSLLILVVVSILIVGFNIVSRMQLNNEKDKLKAYEAQVSKMTSKIVSSNEITERINLYNRVLGKTYSPKSVVDYLNSIASKSGTSKITKFNLGDNLTFVLEGNSSDMENVSKFWYLLSNDPKMDTVTLQSVGSSTNGVRFEFRGKLKIDEFLTLSH